MSSESRIIPKSNIGRLTALNNAKNKSDLMGAGNFLTPSTLSRLTAIQASYLLKYDAIYPATHALSVLTEKKSQTREECATYTSHFIQVFNLAIRRGVWDKADRAYYKLDVSSNAVPPLSSDDDVKNWAYNVVKGEADRIAGGGSAMINPSAAEVDAVYTDFKLDFNHHSTASDLLDTAQEELDALNTEADKVIKKVWDEVETFYNEEEPESMRANALEWGVVYNRVGGEKIITGTVTDLATGLPLEGVSVKFENGIKTVTTAANGQYSLNTTLMDDQIITAKLATYADYAASLKLTEGENMVWNIVLEKIG